MFITRGNQVLFIRPVFPILKLSQAWPTTQVKSWCWNWFQQQLIAQLLVTLISIINWCNINDVVSDNAFNDVQVIDDLTQNKKLECILGSNCGNRVDKTPNPFMPPLKYIILPFLSWNSIYSRTKQFDKRLDKWN